MTHPLFETHRATLNGALEALLAAAQTPISARRKAGIEAEAGICQEVLRCNRKFTDIACAASASLAEAAFVAPRFHVVQSRVPMAA